MQFSWSKCKTMHVWRGQAPNLVTEDELERHDLQPLEAFKDLTLSPARSWYITLRLTRQLRMRESLPDQAAVPSPTHESTPEILHCPSAAGIRILHTGLVPDEARRHGLG